MAATIFAAALALPVLYCVAHYVALPRPLSGIPHDRSLARSIFGDLLSLIDYARRTSENVGWMTLQWAQPHSPIVQVVPRPFARYSLVVISDHCEVVDMLRRRTHELGRSDMTTQMFEGIIPRSNINVQSHDAFKAQLKLWLPTTSKSTATIRPRPPSSGPSNTLLTPQHPVHPSRRPPRRLLQLPATSSV